MQQATGRDVVQLHKQNSPIEPSENGAHEADGVVAHDVRGDEVLYALVCVEDLPSQSGIER